MPLDDEHEQERRVIRECIFEGFWYRSLPLSSITGAAVYLAVKNGRLRANVKYGPWPKVITASFLSYWIGKISYVLSDNCKDKFLRDAPESEVAYHIRRKRGMPNPPHLKEKYGDGPYGSRDESRDLDREEFDPTTLADKFPKMSAKERQILEDCNNEAFYNSSLPLGAFFGGSAYFLQKRGILNQSRLVGPPFQNLPKVIVGLTFGYILGQLVYITSTDCSDRFLLLAPEGEIAKEIRRQRNSPYVQPVEEIPEIDEEEFDEMEKIQKGEYLIPHTDKIMIANEVTTDEVIQNSQR